jgi:transposase InsO family protein
MPPKKRKGGRLEKGVMRFYGAVGDTLCATLWDPGSSINMITPAFAEELRRRRGLRWENCSPRYIGHGSGDGITSAPPAVRRLYADLVLCHKGLTFVQKNVAFYVYQGCLPDVILSSNLLERIPCLERPGEKLLDWDVTADDVERLAAIVDSAQVQQHMVMRATCNSTSGAKIRPNVQQALRELNEQRERLRERVDKAVSAEAEAAVAAVCDEYAVNWRPPGVDPCKLGIFKIQLKDYNKSYVCLPRRCNPLVMAEMRRQVQEQAAAGVIERCEGTPSSVYAIHMARHPAKQTLRFCLDARPLNANTVLMPYAMPDINESLDRLAGYKYYCAFDLSAYFQQFELAEECRDLMAFLIPGDDEHPPEIWRYKRLTFGVVNASFWAQRVLMEALAKFPGCESLRNFIDDICFGANSIKELCEKTRALMEFCKFYNLRLKREKAKLAVGAVRHLGFVVSAEGKSLDPARVDSLVNLQAPTNLKALKSILGSFAFVRGWLADASTTSAPLTDLLSASAQKRGFHWGKEQEDALAELKLLVQTAPVLAKPDYSRPFRIYVDASDVGVGAVLVQMLPNPLTGKEELAAIAYKSRRFSDRERRWVIGEREAFGCRYGLESFREYILQHPDVTLYCDHHNMLNMWSCSSAKIARWRLYMQQYEPFKIVHVEGRENICADALSRLHLYNLMEPKTDNLSDEEARMAAEGEGGDDAELMNCSFGELISAVNTRHAQHARCNHFAFANGYGGKFEQCNLSREGEGRGGRDGTSHVPVSIAVARDPDEKKLEELLRDSEPLSDVQEAVPHLPDAPKESDPEPPPAKRRASAVQTCDADLRESVKKATGTFPNRRLIEQAHGNAHPGVATTWARVQRICNLSPGSVGAVSRDEVRRYVNACPICQKLKPARERLERAAGTIRQRPFTQYAFDVIVLPEADVHGYRYILTVVDSFSGAAELFPLRNSSADEVVQCLVDVMSRWTRPHSLRCDNAKSFASALLRKLCEVAKVQQHFVSPFAHQSNGQVENLNRRVEHVLRVMILDAKLGQPSKNNWSVLLPMVRGIINSKLVHRHGCSANDLLYGAISQREGIFEDEPWNQGTGPSVSGIEMTDGPAAERAAATVKQWREQHEALLASCERAQDDLLDRLAELQGPEAAEVDALQPGDAVLVSVEERGTHKLGARWHGPYLVVEAPVGQKVLLQHLSCRRLGTFQLAMCKRCDLSLMSDVDDWLPLAAQDNFEYVIKEVVAHRPATRAQSGRKKRPKSDFEFQVLWADLPEGEDNPTWEPWANQSLRESEPYKTYLQRPEVVSKLGADFLAP